MRARPSDGENSTTGVGRRQPIPRAELPTDRNENQTALDARRFGARPEGAQGPLLIRRVLRDGPPSDARGPSERSIFQSRNLQGKHDVQGGPPGQLNRFQQRAPRGEIGFQQSPIQARGPIGDGRASTLGRNGAGRSRVSRNSDASESRRRQRGGKSGSGRRRNRDEEPWTHEEQQYLQDKELESQKAPGYAPMEFGRETLTGTWPATASDELGTIEMLRERLLLARRYLEKDFISWGSREQKADVMALAEKLKTVREAKPTDGDEETSKVSGDGNQQLQALMEKFFRGAYGKIKKGRCEILTHVERHALRNDSYYPPDEKMLLEKVKNLLPPRRLDKGGGKNKVEA